MNEADIIKDIRNWWLTNMNTVIVATATGDVRAISLWEDDEGLPEPIQPYNRTTIRSMASEAVSIGRRRAENRGLITVQVFAPTDLGPGPGERMASAIADIWRAYRHSRIKLGEPSVIGLSRDGAFNRQLIQIGWRADMRRAATE